jgi:hypothetical protein
MAVKLGLMNQQRFCTATKANHLEKVKILEIVQLQQINSSIQKTTRNKKTWSQKKSSS